MSGVRTTILKNIVDRIDKNFGVGNSDKKMFREVVRGPLTRATMFSRCVVEDGGQTREAPVDNESGDRVLKVRLYLQVAASWEKATEAEDWTDNVELIAADLQNWAKPGCGILFLNYVSDEPFDVVYTSGETEAVWVMDFDVHYFLEEDGIRDE
jgi:hypothetical protein